MESVANNVLLVQSPKEKELNPVTVVDAVQKDLIIPIVFIVCPDIFQQKEELVKNVKETPIALL